MSEQQNHPRNPEITQDESMSSLPGVLGAAWQAINQLKDTAKAVENLPDGSRYMVRPPSGTEVVAREERVGGTSGLKILNTQNVTAENGFVATGVEIDKYGIRGFNGIPNNPVESSIVFTRPGQVIDGRSFTWKLEVSPEIAGEFSIEPTKVDDNDSTLKLGGEAVAGAVE